MQTSNQVKTSLYNTKATQIRKLLRNQSLSLADIAKEANAHISTVYYHKSQMTKRKKATAADKKAIPTLIQTKAIKKVIPDVATPFPNLEKPKVSIKKDDLQITMDAVDKAYPTDTVEFISDNRLNYNLGRAVELIVNANMSQHQEKLLLLAIRHLAVQVAHHRAGRK